MADMKNYQQIVEDILTWYGNFPVQGGEEYERQLIFDRDHDHYLVLDTGWRYPNRIYTSLVHLDIKDGKIWVQEDMTDPGVVQKLLDRGIPKEDIVLAFHAPYKRPYTEFAVA